MKKVNEVLVSINLAMAIFIPVLLVAKYVLKVI
jgi:hypothetical protein